MASERGPEERRGQRDRAGLLAGWRRTVARDKAQVQQSLQSRWRLISTAHREGGAAAGGRRRGFQPASQSQTECASAGGDGCGQCVHKDTVWWMAGVHQREVRPSGCPDAGLVALPAESATRPQKRTIITRTEDLACKTDALFVPRGGFGVLPEYLLRPGALL